MFAELEVWEKGLQKKIIVNTVGNGGVKLIAWIVRKRDIEESFILSNRCIELCSP